LNKYLRLPIDLLQLLSVYFPGPLGFKFRYRFFKRKLKFLGKGVRIESGVYFQNPRFISIDDNAWIDRNATILAGPPGSERITYLKSNPDFKLSTGEVYIGKYSHIAPNCVLSGIGGLQIGRNCGIASNSTVYSFSHHYKNLNDKNDKWQYSFTPLARSDQQSMILGPVVIEDYCAIGLNSTILPGATLKKGTWVGSGSVISERFEEQTLVLSNHLDNRQKSLAHLKIRS
jgi:acetyltransferase-like isoleucine patch superfamily enzyme